MHLIALGWIYVVLLMAAAEWMSPHGTGVGALAIMLLYGALPLALVLYIRAAAMRRRARRRGDAAPAHAEASRLDPDGRSVPARDAVAPVREEV